MEIKFIQLLRKTEKDSIENTRTFYERLELFVQDRFNRILNNHSVDDTKLQKHPSAATTEPFSRIMERQLFYQHWYAFFSVLNRRFVGQSPPAPLAAKK